MKGLYIISTPIGNLQDITLRAINVLRDVDLILCENVLMSKRLFKSHNIEPKGLTTLNLQTSTPNKISKIIDKIQAGESVALISDAGTPLISDPGHEIVETMRSKNLPIYSIPGCCALVAALAVSGCQASGFTFIGFLPQSNPQRRRQLSTLEHLSNSIVFYEGTII